MSSKITPYLDCVSPYSYYALLHLEKNRKVLEAHGVEIDIVPVFLGGINVGSGNKPPWSLEAKAKYGEYDNERAKQRFGVLDLQSPSFFPILSLLPQRAMCYVKEAHGEQFISIFFDIFAAMWQKGKDVSKPEVLAEVLGQRLKEDEVQDVMTKASSPPYKQRLNDNTKEALDRGAFGCPWIVVRNSKGKEEPFFGSDSPLPRLAYLPVASGEGWMAAGTSGFSMAPAADTVYPGVGLRVNVETMELDERTVEGWGAC
ncbi:thioredoxin-like protein [Stemphylium lycopersici]|uniref:Glutathione S-transferase kappa 1 n=1 Tax=Stemphylium lycopersici TaxID=183478 RepID=A0A364NDP9_STELY|nr:thioredoxin-like protein [Stemphylium lycopersici]